ncbi:hypothetical protein AMTRI_Chr10g7150 [Amborella trichopoda]
MLSFMRKPTFRLLSLSLPFLTSSFSSCRRKNCFSPFSLQPPKPKKLPSSVTAHGLSWVDPYRWMSNLDDPDLPTYLQEENNYAEAFMADTEHIQRELVAEMKERMPSSVFTPPEKWGPWLYYQTIPKGKEYPVLCRRIGTNDTLMERIVGYMGGNREEDVLLDWNKIAEQFGYVHIGTCQVSPDHRYLAYTLDMTGQELFMLQIKDLETGCLISNSFVRGVVSLAWAKDSRTLLYTVVDETQRPHRVFSRSLGSDDTDCLIYEESDLSCSVDITSTKDGKFITVYLLDSSNLKDGLQLVWKRASGVQYFLEHHYGYFYILTNSPLGCSQFVAEGYHLARCQAETLRSGEWQNIIQAGQGVEIQDMDIFDGHLVLFLHRGGIPKICSIKMPLEFPLKHPMDIEDLNPWFFPLPSDTSSVVPGSNHDFMDSTFRVVISSPVMPDAVVDYDMLKQDFTIVHQEKVLGIDSFDVNENDTVKARHNWSYISQLYSCERKEVLSLDGVHVPLTILYSKKVEINGKSPGILMGYGAYGEVLEKNWCTDRISLLDRGWVIAFADVRGGGGLGMSWHHDGAGPYKLKSILDFVACGMYLVNEGYINRHRLGAVGFSAGGLLVGAAINLYPDLFCAAILKVPFLDICNTLLNPSLPLTTLDYEEFGDPTIQAQFEMIRCYSPYDNIQQGVCYPSMLVTSSFNDSRVGVWEGAKWVARVREETCRSCSSSVVLRTNMEGGHFGEGGRYKHCEETAYEYAFLIKMMSEIA